MTAWMSGAYLGIKSIPNPLIGILHEKGDAENPLKWELQDLLGLIKDLYRIKITEPYRELKDNSQSYHISIANASLCHIFYDLLDVKECEEVIANHFPESEVCEDNYMEFYDDNLAEKLWKNFEDYFPMLSNDTTGSWKLKGIHSNFTIKRIPSDYVEIQDSLPESKTHSNEEQKVIKIYMCLNSNFSGGKVKVNFPNKLEIEEQFDTRGTCFVFTADEWRTLEDLCLDIYAMTGLNETRVTLGTKYVLQGEIEYDKVTPWYTSWSFLTAAVGLGSIGTMYFLKSNR